MPQPVDSGEPMDDPRALQILLAEQSSLIAARAQNQAEVSSRASMFVAALSGSLVALAFVAQATRFGAEALAFATLLLPVVLFLGITTFIRVVDLSAEEVRWVVALNRLRKAYVDMVPALEPYFATWRADDRSAAIATLSPVRQTFTRAYGLATTPGVIAVLASVVAAALAAAVATLLRADLATTLVIAAAVFLVVLLVLAMYGARVFDRAIEA